MSDEIPIFLIISSFSVIGQILFFTECNILNFINGQTSKLALVVYLSYMLSICGHTPTRRVWQRFIENWPHVGTPYTCRLRSLYYLYSNLFFEFVSLVKNAILYFKYNSDKICGIRKNVNLLSTGLVDISTTNFARHSTWHILSFYAQILC